MSLWLALTLLAAPHTVLVAPEGAPFVGLVVDVDGGAFVARADGVVVHVDADGVVVDEACVDCARARVRRRGADRRAPGLRVDQAFSLARRGDAPFLTQNAWDLFVFPYGTTGEPYLEFAPDSPAFWGVVRGAKNTTFTVVDDVGLVEGRVALRSAAPPRAPGAGGVDAGDADAGDAARATRWTFSPERVRRTLDEPSDAGGVGDTDVEGCRAAPTMEQTLRGVMASDAVSARLGRGVEPPLLWRLFPVVDVAAGSVHVDAVADVIAVFRDGVEHSAPAGFVRRTLQGHVENDDAAALARRRTTDMPYGVVLLRFDLDRLVGEPRDVRALERMWRPIAERRLARAAALVDEHARLCARPPTVSAQLRRAAIVDELAIVSAPWRIARREVPVLVLEDP